MRRVWSALLVLGVVVSGSRLAAQGGARPLVTVQVEPAAVKVGERFNVRLRVRAPAGASIRLPVVPDSASAVEAVDPRLVEDHSTADVIDLQATYAFAAWEPGKRSAPLSGLEWTHDGVTEPLAIPPMVVEVSPTLPSDTAAMQPKAARDTFGAPPQWWRWVLGAIIVAAIALLIWRARRRRQLPAGAADAFRDAERGFAAVQKAAFDDAGEPGHAVLAYAEVMRTYLTRRFPAAGEGLTTGDYVAVLAENGLPILPEEVSDVLVAADSVKFAGAAVDASGVAAVARRARAVVRDVQTAYEARLAAADKGKGPRGRRRGK